MFGIVLGAHPDQCCSSTPIVSIRKTVGHDVCGLFASATTLDIHLIACAEHITKPSKVYSVGSRNDVKLDSCLI